MFLVSSVCATILLLRSWVIFTLITLNSSPGRLPVSTSLFWGFIPGFFVWNMFLSWLMLSNFPCLCSLFLRLQDCGSSCFWRLPLVGEVDPGACADLLLGETAACPPPPALNCPCEWIWSCLCLQGCVTGCVWRQLLAQGGIWAACLFLSWAVLPPLWWLWGIPALEPAGCWGGQASGSAHACEQCASRCHRRPCPRREPQPAPASPGSRPRPAGSPSPGLRGVAV